MIHILAPCFNEAPNLRLFFERLETVLLRENQSFRFVMVDDGSTDATPDILKETACKFPVEIVTHATNRGAGRAFQSGFERILEDASDSDTVITIEADNTSDLDILPRMIRTLEENEADAVLASCYAKGGRVLGTNRLRIAISWIANRLVEWLFGLEKLHTFSCFYRGIRAGILRRALFAYEGRLITRPGYICMVEMLINLSRLPVSIREIPAVLDCDRRRGTSKMKIMKTSLSYFRFFCSQGLRDRQKRLLVRKRWDAYPG